MPRNDSGLRIAQTQQGVRRRSHAPDPAIGAVVDDRVGTYADYVATHQNVGVAEEDVYVAVGVRLLQVTVVDRLAAELQRAGRIEGLVRERVSGQPLEHRVLPLGIDIRPKP